MGLELYQGEQRCKRKLERQTWLSHEVATSKLALGLKLRLETESLGGGITYSSLQIALDYKNLHPNFELASGNPPAVEELHQTSNRR